MRWRSEADARVAPFVIVEDLNMLEERRSGLTPGGEPGAMPDLGFKRAEEAFYGSMALAIAFSAHGGLDAMSLEQLLVIAASVLHAMIRMVGHPFWRSLVSDHYL